VTILKQILDEIKTDDETQKIRQLCDQIQKEETQGKEDKLAPKGPNIFVSLEVLGRTVKEVSFLTLEREVNSKYIVALYTILKSKILDDGALKKVKVWDIEDKRPEKILTFYAKQFKYLKGE
jgi:hypothetical protein